MPAALDWLVVGDIGLEIGDQSRGSGAILGGAAARLAAHGAALGLKVALAGKVGQDEAGAQARDELKRLKVDLAWLQVVPGMRTTLWYESSRRGEALRIQRGADLALRLDELPPASTTPARLTLVSGFSLSVEPARAAALGALKTAGRRAGRAALQLEADRLWSTNARITRRVLEPALAMADSVALTAADVRVLFGARTASSEAAREISRMGPRLVYVEEPDGGALLQEGARSHALPARGGHGPVDRFAGPAAFWVGLARGMTPRKAALMGVGHAGSIRRPGAPRRTVSL